MQGVLTRACIMRTLTRDIRVAEHAQCCALSPTLCMCVHAYVRACVRVHACHLAAAARSIQIRDDTPICAHACAPSACAHVRVLVCVRTPRSTRTALVAETYPIHGIYESSNKCDKRCACMHRADATLVDVHSVAEHVHAPVCVCM